MPLLLTQPRRSPFHAVRRVLSVGPSLTFRWEGRKVDEVWYEELENVSQIQKRAKFGLFSGISEFRNRDHGVICHLKATRPNNMTEMVVVLGEELAFL